MTDAQLLISIRLRASYRPSNFPFIEILNELEAQSRSRKLERDVMDHFVDVCKIYYIKLDEFDMKCINEERKANADEQSLDKLLAVGFIVHQDKHMGRRKHE